MAFPGVADAPARRMRASLALRGNDDLLKQFNLICPVQSHLQKFSASPLTQITSISLAVSSHEGGVSRSSRTRGGMRWTRQRRACDVIAGRGLVSDQRHADERRYSRTAKPCGPGTRCWCQVSGGESARPGLDKPYRRMTVT